MLKTDISLAINILNESLLHHGNDYMIKVHKMYKPTPVNKGWLIDEGRLNQDIHLLYVLEGKGTYTLGTEQIPMKKGQLYLVTNDFPHGAYSDQSDLVHIVSMRFGIYSATTGHYLPNFFTKPFGTMVTVDHPDLYQDLLDRTYHHFLEDGPNKDFAIHALMAQLLLTLVEIHPSTDILTMIHTITSKIINTHGKEMTIDHLAAQIGLSTKQFTRLFHQSNHTTPHQFIIQTRINHAKYLLEETNLSIKAIALELGYADAFTFSRQFKKVAGIPPTIYRSK